LIVGALSIMSKALAPMTCTGKRARNCTRARGDERLSGRQNDDPGSTSQDRSAKAAGDKKGRKKAADIGRALRSIYDDTLRESVPDDFSDLLGKLS